MSPEVSVVMAVYNGAGHLRQGVEGILTQTCDDFEFIIIDDGSTDETSSILDTYSDPRIVRLHNKYNLGLTQSLNIGLDTARGEYIARQDCDDRSHPCRLAKQTDYLKTHPSTVLHGTAAREIGPSGEDFGVHSQPCGDTTIRWKLLLHNAFIHSTVMMRQKTLHKHNLKYNPELPYSQDFDLWSRMLPYGSLANMAETLVDLRLHARQRTHTGWESQQMIADQISRRNMNAMGLGMSLSDDDLAILRWRAGKTVACEGWHRIREGQLLFGLLLSYDKSVQHNDAEWKCVYQQQLQYIRQCLAFFPTNPTLLVNQIRLAVHDPTGLLHDLLRKVTRSLHRQPA